MKDVNIFTMVDEEHYSNRQIERMLDLQTVEFEKIVKSATDPILIQTTKTNGRVSKLEEDVVGYKVWRGWMTGGMACLMILLPVLSATIVYIFLNHHG